MKKPTRRTISLILCFIFLSNISNFHVIECPKAQQENDEFGWEWAISPEVKNVIESNLCFEYNCDITIDRKDNIIITGNFRGEISFGTTILESRSERDTFVAKIDNEGNWIWAKRCGGIRGCPEPSITVDSQDNIIISGVVYQPNQNHGDFGPFNMTNGAYIAKIDTNGNWLWLKSIYATNIWEAEVVVDSKDNIIVSGQTADKITIGDYVLDAKGKWKIFVAKIDENGNWEWGRISDGDNYQLYSCSEIDNEDNVVITGGFMGTATFGPTTLVYPDKKDSYNLLVAKIDSEGNWLWANSAEGEYQKNVLNLYPLSCTIDSYGSIYLTGKFYKNASIGASEISGDWGGDIFISKIYTTGEWIYTHEFNGQGQESAFDILIDSKNNILLTGRFDHPEGFGDFEFESTFGYDFRMFLAKINQEGVGLWAKNLGHLSNYNGHKFVFDSEKNIIFSGAFEGEKFFEPYNLQTNESEQLFVAKLNYNELDQDSLSSIRFFNPDPVDKSKDISSDKITLSWNSELLNIESVNYDIYLGKSQSSLDKIAENISFTSYTLQNLEFEQEYYWKIIAWDENSALTSSPVWSFTTEKESKKSDSIIVTYHGAEKYNIDDYNTFFISMYNSGSEETTINEIQISENWINCVDYPDSIDGFSTRSARFEMQIPSYIPPGNNTVSVTIHTSTYGVITKEITLNVFPESSTKTIVTAYDKETNNPLSNVMIMIDDEESLYHTNSLGKITIPNSMGSHTLYLWKEGFLSKEYHFQCDKEQNEVSIFLEPGSVILENVNITPLNYSEIEDAGINIQDPENYDYYEFTVDLFVEEHELSESDYWFEIEDNSIEHMAKEKIKTASKEVVQWTQENAGTWSGTSDGSHKHYGWVENGTHVLQQITIHYNDSSGNSGYYKHVDNLVEKAKEISDEVKDAIDDLVHPPEAHAWLHVQGETHLLKEFFEVSLEITNNAPSSMYFKDISAELYYPTGLSLPPLYGLDQSSTSEIDDIYGQTSDNASWIIRGDELGEYQIVIDLDCIFMPFSVPLEITGSTFVEVFGLSRLEPVFMPARYVRKELPFLLTMGIRNPSSVPAYLVTVQLNESNFQNLTLIDEAFKEIGTIEPGETRYVSWTLQSDTSGCVVLDASSVYTNKDYILKPQLTFYGDSAEGLVTAFYLACQQQLNSEAHGLSSVETNFRMVHRTTFSDLIWFSLETTVLILELRELLHIDTDKPMADLSAELTGHLIKDYLGIYAYNKSLTHFLEGISYNRDMDDDYFSKLSEEQIIENISSTIMNEIYIKMNISDENLTTNDVISWQNEKYNETIDLMRDKDFSVFSENETKYIQHIIHQLQVAFRQNHFIQLHNQTIRLGSLYPLFSESYSLRKDYDFFKNTGNVVTLGQLFLLLSGSGFIIRFILGSGLSLGKIYIANAAEEIRTMLHLNQRVSHAAYQIDIESLTNIQIAIYDLIQKMINDSVSDENMFSEIDGVNIQSLKTPNIVSESSTGNETGHMILSNSNSDATIASGSIVIRSTSEGNPIIHIIPFSEEIPGNGNVTVSFEYNVSIIPGQTQEYIAEAILSRYNTESSIISLFHAGTEEIISTKGEHFVDISELEKKSVQMRLPSYSSILIASSAPGIDLHVYEDENHVGMNYETGVIDTQILDSRYSGYQSQPQWIEVPNNSPQTKDLTISIQGVDIPFPSNISIYYLIIPMANQPIFYPEELDTTIARNKMSHLGLILESQSSTMTINNVTFQGGITSIIQDIQYEKTLVEYGFSSVIDLSVFSVDENTYTGKIFINYSTPERKDVIKEIPVTINVVDTAPGIDILTNDILGDQNRSYVNISCMVEDNDEVEDVRFCILRPNGKLSEVPMINKINSDYYYLNSSYITAGDFEYYIQSSDNMNNTVTSQTFSFSIADSASAESSASGTPGFESIMLFILIAMYVALRRRKIN